MLFQTDIFWSGMLLVHVWISIENHCGFQQGYDAAVADSYLAWPLIGWKKFGKPLDVKNLPFFCNWVLCTIAIDIYWAKYSIDWDCQPVLSLKKWGYLESENHLLLDPWCISWKMFQNRLILSDCKCWTCGKTFTTHACLARSSCLEYYYFCEVLVPPASLTVRPWKYTIPKGSRIRLPVPSGFQPIGGLLD